MSIAWVLVHMRDTITQNQGNRYCERKNLVRLLGICSVILISMTKAVAYAAGSYAFHCLGQEGFHNSLKPEEALIYLYDGRVVFTSSSWKHHRKHKDLP